MNRSQWTYQVLLLATLGLSAGIASAQTPLRVEEWTRSADVVFRGTVQRAGASNLSAVTPAGDTAIVRMDEVLKAPADIRDFVGREVTVKLQTAGSATAGTRAVFFAHTWLYGESLGFVEVGRAHAATPGLRSQVSQVTQTMHEEEVRGHLAAAPLVVTGRVVETRPPVPGPHWSEHDPVWAEAVLRVDSVLKGTAGDHVVLVYPSTLDVMWYQAPKPRVGWDGVWLLSPAQGEEMKGRANIYTALQPWTVMSRDDAGLVRRLVQP